MIIYLLSNLLHTRQWVQYFQVRLSHAEQLSVEYIDVFDALILLRIQKPFPLYTCHVEYIRLGNYLGGKLGYLLKGDVILPTIGAILLRQSQLFGCHKNKSWGEGLHSLYQRMNGTPILQVAHHHYSFLL